MTDDARSGFVIYFLNELAGGRKLVRTTVGCGSGLWRSSRELPLAAAQSQKTKIQLLIAAHIDN